MNGTMTRYYTDNTMNRTDTMFRERSFSRTLPLLLWGISALVITVWFLLDTTAGFGSLPGDVWLMIDGTRIYLPFSTTMIVSVLVTGLFYAIGSFFSRR